MRNLFTTTDPELTSGDNSKLLNVYKDGRRDERAQGPHGIEPHAQEALIRDAYKDGRRDERARKRGSPLMVLILLVAALVGGAMVVMAVREGSFAGGGAAIDGQVAKATDAAAQATATAAAKTAAAVRDAPKPQ